MGNPNGLGVVFRKTVRRYKALSLLTVVLIAACVTAALFPPLVLEQIVNRLTAQQAVAPPLPLLLILVSWCFPACWNPGRM